MPQSRESKEGNAKDLDDVCLVRSSKIGTWRARPRRYILVSLLCLLILVPVVVLAQAFGASKVDRKLISRDMAWPSSGAWVGNSLYVVDAAAQEVRGLKTDGPLGSLQDEQVAILAAKAARPSIIRCSEERVFLEDEETDVIFSLPLAGGEEPEETQIKQRPSGGLQLKAVYDWAPLGDGFLAFADFIDREKDWNAGFVFFDKRGIRHVYQEIERHNPARNRYLRTAPSYIATIGDTGFFLNLVDMGSPSISRVGLHSEVKDDLEPPAEFSNHPVLDGHSLPGYGPTKETAILKTFEVSRMPAGIVAWNQELYVLGKEPLNKVDGSTDWWLIGIHSESGKVLSRAVLPTNAAHLSLYPGTSLSLLEKAPVVGYGKLNAPYLEAISVVTIPQTVDLDLSSLVKPAIMATMR